MENNFLSMKQTAAVLDNAPVAIYVTAVDNFELLYANPLAKALMLRPGQQGITCYQAAGFDKPCPFCRAEKMSRKELLVREFCHRQSGRVYQLSGKIIDWEGRSAHIEYVIDVTEKKKEEARSNQRKEELQATFSNIPCGLCVYEFDGQRIVPLFHNPAFYEIMGYSETHIRTVEQETNFLGVHPEDLCLLQKKIQQAIENDCVMRHTYRLWNDKKAEYRWIHLDGAVKPQPDGKKLLYGVYNDVSEQRQLEESLTSAKKKTQDIINAIPGGVAVYKVSDIFQPVYFSDGVPELSGYTPEEYLELTRYDAMKLVYPEDAGAVAQSLRKTIQNHTIADLEFRKLHRDGRVVWVRVQARQIGEEDGIPLLHCVFHNISALKETQLELDHLINSIPGGIASYQIEGNRLAPLFYSDGLPALSGYTKAEYGAMIRQDAFHNIYEPDRDRVLAEAHAALKNGAVLDVSFRIRHKNGTLVWVHLNGRRIGPPSGSTRLYAVFTGMSSETRLFQKIANETADGIYVIDKETYELLYANESKNLFGCGQPHVGEKCYAALHKKSAPCEFCTLKKYNPDGREHTIGIDITGRFYTSRFHETNWNGIPAYVQYIREVTEEVNTRREKERLELYFQTMVKNLPGGISVIRCESEDKLVPEFVSEGFAAMLHTSVEKMKQLYEDDPFAGIHPADAPKHHKKLLEFVQKGEGHCELTARMKQENGGYVWVKSTLSLLQATDGTRRLYSIYTDVSKAMEEKEQLRRQYEDILLQHYRKPGSNELILGHCNVTQNKILEIWDHTNSSLLKTFGTDREKFFTGIAGLLVDETERQAFLNQYLNAPALAAFRRKETEQILKCFIKLPQESLGRYVQFKVNLIETPDTGDVTGVLTVTDITEETISDKILHQLSVTSYDYVIDLNLKQDHYTVLTCGEHTARAPQPQGSHSGRVAHMAQSVIAPKDREAYALALNPDEIRRRLKEKNSYTFSYSMLTEKGDIRTKNMTVSAVDRRLDRFCLVCSDITDSVREEQSLLNMMAYTFELMGLLHISSKQFTMYTRQTVLENLSPYVVQCYDRKVEEFANAYGTQEDRESVHRQFQIETMLRRLSEQPGGYDFVFPYQSKEGRRYKQINVLWGDENHSTICMVRADVTEMLAAERQSKQKLEKALVLAEEANKAKSDFLSTMSHDIRTPMNAIMGMTTLAFAHLNDRDRVEDCLQKISVSSKHLLSLINDILDMSKIEQSKISLNHMRIFLPELVEQLCAIMLPQAKAAGLELAIHSNGIRHEHFYGDSLRINQVLINLLSNAVKFTPENGRIDFLIEEFPPVKNPEHIRYRFTVRDTGIGMPEEFLATLFAPFARSRAVSRIEGTGLGLSITKGLVDLMDGEISVESQLGQGSVFRVELEFEPAQIQTERTKIEAFASNQKKVLAGRTFLIAEDNAINAEILSELLKLDGADFVIKPDGAAAVQAFEKAPPQTYDAILMDVQMPEMNGYEATRAIRALKRPDAKTIPIIAMTANAFAEDIQASLDAGMNAHVAKPINMDILKTTLQKALKPAKTQ